MTSGLTDDLRQASIAGGGLGGRTPGMRGRTSLGAGRLNGASEGPAARRRTRPAGRTGLGGRISDGSILSADESSASTVAAGMLLSGGAQLPSGTAVVRLSAARCKSGRLDDVVRYYNMRIGPAYDACRGFKVAYLLVDRPSSTVHSMSFWDSNDSLLASIEDEHYQKVAKGLLQLVDPNSIDAQTFEMGAVISGSGSDFADRGVAD